MKTEIKYYVTKLTDVYKDDFVIPLEVAKEKKKKVDISDMQDEAKSFETM